MEEPSGDRVRFVTVRPIWGGVRLTAAVDTVLIMVTARRVCMTTD